MNIHIIARHLKRAVRVASSWIKTTGGLLVVLITVMVAAVIGGFWTISLEQKEQLAVRELARNMRLARQAVMEMDTAVLHAMLQKREQENSVDFTRAYERAISHKAESFPASVSTPDGERNGQESVNDLIARFNRVLDLVRSRDWAGAEKAYDEGGIRDCMAQIIKAYRADLDVIEVQFSDFNRKIGVTSTALLLLQMLTGALSVTAFLYALRRSNREAKARTLAVISANETRDHVERLFSMADMLQSASDQMDANAVLRSAASDLLFGFSGALYVFNNSRDRLILSTTWERDGYHPLTESLGLNQCWALKRGKPHINRPNSRKLCCEHHDGVDYALEIPMTARGEILGLLQVYAQGDEAEERLLKVQGLATAIADAMSLALANIALREKLRGQALRDPLTGLYNRRYMEDTLQRFVRLAEREEREFSAIMIDLDHFKRLNDQHGHAKGDAVLRDSAAAIVNQLRETDVACRYGGEELIILLPDCALDVAVVKAESIRVAIEGLSEPNGAQVSASIGVSSFPATSASAKDLVAAADAALYQAKQGGRARMVISPMVA